MIRIDRSSPIPVYKQIIYQIKKDILLGRLKDGDKLPTVRDLAEKLNVNVNTVLKAYERLVVEGILDSIQGKGYFVRGETSIERGILEDLRKIVSRMKGSGVDLGLAMILLQEVWNDEKV